MLYFEHFEVLCWLILHETKQRYIDLKQRMIVLYFKTSFENQTEFFATMSFFTHFRLFDLLGENRNVCFYSFGQKIRENNT